MASISDGGGEFEQGGFRPVRELSAETARKIAAGEVIERPASALRELLDNAIDSGAGRIFAEIEKGGMERIRVSDDGCGMTKEDLALCVKNHTTSKIASADDLLSAATLGFRGEALASINAVSRLEITSAREGVAYKLIPGGKVVPAARSKGTLVEASGIFADFPARRQFLKRPQAEAALCRQAFSDKALCWPKIEFRLTVDGSPRAILKPAASFKERCLDVLKPQEGAAFFNEIRGEGAAFSFAAVLGFPEVARRDRRAQFVFVNGRRISDFGLQQAVEFGAEGRFPNGLHPFFCLFVKCDPCMVDFNIHPAKKEARFLEPAEIHHAVSASCREFYRPLLPFRYGGEEKPAGQGGQEAAFGFAAMETADISPRYSGRHWQEGAPSWKAEAPSLERKAFASYSAAECAREVAEYEECGGEPSAETSLAEARLKDFGAAILDIPQDFRFLGQVLGTFIAAEKQGRLFLIDQHAAHERIIYNEIIASQGASQALLVPYRIATPDRQTDNKLRGRQEALRKAGFSLHDEGDGLWTVTAVPVRWTGSERELADELLGGDAEPERLVLRLYASEACRSACKDGDILDPAAARSIAAKALSLPEPFCPHGRPVYTEITREELFRRVKRT